jgi:Uma2 family endonuclease
MVRVIHPDEFAKLPDAKRFDLVDGRLFERAADYSDRWIAGEIFARLANYGTIHEHGWAFPPATGFTFRYHDFEYVRRPDASYVLRDRMPHGQSGMGHCRIRPDLAVEVISPGDLYFDVEQKVKEYLDVGIRQVWVISAQSRTVLAYSRGASPRLFHETDELVAEDLLPGFRCRVADLFPVWQTRPVGNPDA